MSRLETRQDPKGSEEQRTIGLSDRRRTVRGGRTTDGAAGDRLGEETNPWIGVNPGAHASAGGQRGRPALRARSPFIPCRSAKLEDHRIAPEDEFESRSMARIGERRRRGKAHDPGSGVHDPGRSSLARGFAWTGAQGEAEPLAQAQGGDTIDAD